MAGELYIADKATLDKVDSDLARNSRLEYLESKNAKNFYAEVRTSPVITGNTINIHSLTGSGFIHMAILGGLTPTIEARLYLTIIIDDIVVDRSSVNINASSNNGCGFIDKDYLYTTNTGAIMVPAFGHVPIVYPGGSILRSPSVKDSNTIISQGIFTLTKPLRYNKSAVFQISTDSPNYISPNLYSIYEKD